MRGQHSLVLGQKKIKKLIAYQNFSIMLAFTTFLNPFSFFIFSNIATRGTNKKMYCIDPMHKWRQFE